MNIQSSHDKKSSKKASKFNADLRSDDDDSSLLSSDDDDDAVVVEGVGRVVDPYLLSSIRIEDEERKGKGSSES